MSLVADGIVILLPFFCNYLMSSFRLYNLFHLLAKIGFIFVFAFATCQGVYLLFEELDWENKEVLFGLYGVSILAHFFVWIGNEEQPFEEEDDE